MTTKLTRLPRASGVLLHPTSLPGRFGIGDLGPHARVFLDQLQQAGQRWWQILPLGPTGYGNSPYQSYSSFAGNPLLISPEALASEGWLAPSDWSGLPVPRENQVEYEAVARAKDVLFRGAFKRFPENHEGLRGFVAASGSWLDDYALFMALKEAQGGKAWFDWPQSLARRSIKALKAARKEHAEAIRYHQFLQYAFDRQWGSLRQASRERGISILGDLPIFVAVDSADVWSRPDLFSLDKSGRPTVVAGVPPDYFAATGQLWGNPLYRWEAHREEGYAWWTARIKAQMARVDLLRLDHFRGFEAYWEVPAGSKTAEHGRWVRGPGSEFLEAIGTNLGSLPLVAEDLGDISPEVELLRDEFTLPGMRVLQFGLAGSPGTDFHLPYTFVPHCIAYTGTHDNDTTQGWLRTDGAIPSHRPGQGKDKDKGRHFASRFLDADDGELHWAAIRAVSASVADTVIFPAQDLLGLGSEARMNVPGVPEANWRWRLPAEMLPGNIRDRLRELTFVQGRCNAASVPSPDSESQRGQIEPGQPSEPTTEPGAPPAKPTRKTRTKR